MGAPVAPTVESPNVDPGGPPKSATRIRRTNAEREAELKARDVEATEKQLAVDSKAKELVEQVRVKESTEARPIFAMAYSGGFNMLGRFRSRKLPPKAKAAIQEVYAIDKEACNDVAYRTARVCHKWIGLEWIKWIDEEAMLLMALVKLIDTITDSEARILRKLGITEVAKPKTETQGPPATSKAALPPPAPPEAEAVAYVGPSGEDTTPYEFDDIAKVKDSDG